MKVLIVVATEAEARGLLKSPENHLPVGSLIQNSLIVNADLLITGVGMTATAFHLGRVLIGYKPDLILNIGLAGTFNHQWPLGKLVEVVCDEFADLGAEDHDRFHDLFDLKLLNEDEEPFTEKTVIPLPCQFETFNSRLEKAIGITVNTVHGSQASIDAVRKRLNPDVESMEGAAVFYASRLCGIPAIQWRAISNYVEPRNRESWKIPEALKSLWTEVLQVLSAPKV